MDNPLRQANARVDVSVIDVVSITLVSMSLLASLTLNNPRTTIVPFSNMTLTM